MQFFSLLIMIVLLGTTQQLQAQIKRGTMSVGMNLSMQYSNNDASSSIPTDTYFGMGILLTSESFVRDNFSIIGGLGWEYGNQHTVFKQYNYLNTAYTNDNRYLSNIYSPTIGIRKYWFQPEGRLGLFVSPMARVSYRITNRTETTTNPNIPLDKREQEIKRETWVLGFTGDVGLCYFIVPHLSLELSTPLIQANAQKNYQSFHIVSNLNNISYGVRYYF